MQYVLFFLGISAYSTALQADIRADTNRDGIVDLKGVSDVENKHTWTSERGAIFLPNIGDTNRRCSQLALNCSSPLSNEDLAACHDASDEIQRAPQYMAPLRTVPLPNVSDSAYGHITVSDSHQRGIVRIFTQRQDEWVFVRDTDPFSSEDLRRGLVLGIDARDTRRPGKLDGRVTVQFTVEDNGARSTDQVMLRVAPVLTHHHLQRVDQILSVKGNDTSSPWQKLFTDNLAAATKHDGLPEPLHLFDQSDDVWAQDFVEPGYASMPGPDGPVSIRIHVRSAQDSRVAGRQVFEYLREAGVGAVQELGGARDEINSMGNLECIPPFTNNGTTFPNGRIIMGRHGPYTPHILDYFRAQETQDPLLLDTAWLFIGHVDEFVQFLPAQNDRGWVMAVADPLAGIDILRTAQEAGHGSTRLHSRKADPQFPGADCDENTFGCISFPVPNTTIDAVLSREDFVSVNNECSSRIEANIEIIRSATGIVHEEIYRIPALFDQADLDVLPTVGRRAPNETLAAVALWPGTINGVVLTGYGKYLVPNPWGPVIDGIDVVAEAIRAEYAKLGFDVDLIDNWNSHHNYGGEVHCGTNTIRDTSKPWWH